MCPGLAPISFSPQIERIGIASRGKKVVAVERTCSPTRARRLPPLLSTYRHRFSLNRPSGYAVDEPKTAEESPRADEKRWNREAAATAGGSPRQSLQRPRTSLVRFHLGSDRDTKRTIYSNKLLGRQLGTQLIGWPEWEGAGDGKYKNREPANDDLSSLPSVHLKHD